VKKGLATSNTVYCLAVQVENNSLAEALTRQKAEVTVLSQKRARVEQALEAQVKESKALKVAAQRLQVGRRTQSTSSVCRRCRAVKSHTFQATLVSLAMP
jgi:hypothetical protein